MSFDQAYQDAKATAQKVIDDFNTKHGNTQFGSAGLAAAKGLKDIEGAVAAFRNGDTMGGSAGVLRGIGSLSGALTLAG